LAALVRNRRDRDILHPHLSKAGTVQKADESAGKASLQKPTADKPKPNDKAKPVVDKPKPNDKAKPVVDKPKPNDKAKPVVDKPKPAAKPGQVAKKSPAKTAPAKPFVDRQLRMGLDYLNAEFVRAAAK
jgi:outer membrane biosynthesis protein TonB